MKKGQFGKRLQKDLFKMALRYGRVEVEEPEEAEATIAESTEAVPAAEVTEVETATEAAATEE